MNIVRWLGRPAATFMYAAELSPARPGSAAYGGPEKAEAERSAPRQDQIYRLATQGKTDQEIVDFARGAGGFPSICRTIMLWLRATVAAGELEIGLDLGDGGPWTFRSSDGRSSFQYRVKRSARSVVHASAADFMRLVFQDLDPEAACASGHVQIEGDSGQVITLFRSIVLGS
jgi:SCP-2 sterol transfer family